jgi:hypothetical protein
MQSANGDADWSFDRSKPAWLHLSSNYRAIGVKGDIPAPPASII